LSHASEDDRLVEQAAESLGRRGLSVWHDGLSRINDPAPRDLLLKQVANADCIVVMLTRHSARNSWVSQEIGLAFRDKKPVIVARFDKTEIPSHLQNLPVADLTREAGLLRLGGEHGWLQNLTQSLREEDERMFNALAIEYFKKETSRSEEGHRAQLGLNLGCAAMIVILLVARSC